MTHTNRDIADYYNQTLNHYQKWWKLDNVLAVHYGYWNKDTKNFTEALKNTNRVLLEIAGIKESERILDAGCGVGGSSFFLGSERKAKVTGITLSEKQIEFALRKCNELQLNHLVDFKLEDYSNTSFADNTFNTIWAIESITSAPDKTRFANEAMRILKPGGRLIIADYFKTNKKEDPNRWLEKWQNSWSLAEIIKTDDYIMKFEETGLALVKKENITSNIYPSAKRMYQSSIIGAVPSVIYNTFHNTSRFAKNHYKSGYYQYKALKAGLWEYLVLLFEKERDKS